MSLQLMAIKKEVAGLQPWLSRIWDFVQCDRLVMPFGKFKVTATMWHAWVPVVDEYGSVRFRQASSAAELAVELPQSWRESIAKREVALAPGFGFAWTGDINPRFRPTSDSIILTWPQATVWTRIDGWPDILEPEVRAVYLTRDRGQVMAAVAGVTVSGMFLARE